MAVREKEGGGSVAVDWRRMCEAGGHRLQRRAAAAASPAARPWNCSFSLPYFVVCKSDWRFFLYRVMITFDLEWV